MGIPGPRLSFRFTLRTLLIVLVLASVPLGWLGWQAQIVRVRKSTMIEVENLRGFCTLAEFSLAGVEPARVRVGLLSDAPVATINLPADTNIDVRRRLAKIFPEAQIVAYGQDGNDYGPLIRVPFVDETENTSESHP